MKNSTLALLALFSFNVYAQSVSQPSSNPQSFGMDSTDVVPTPYLIPQTQTLSSFTAYVQGACNPTYSTVTNLCISVAGAYGIPATSTTGTASFSRDSCTGALTYQSGCSAPPAPTPPTVPPPAPTPPTVPPPAPTPPSVPPTGPTSNPVSSTVNCASVAGNYGVPSSNTVGTTTETTEGNPALPTYGNIISVSGAGCSAPTSTPPSSPVDTCTTTNSTTACGPIAGTYGIPSNYTQGTAAYSYQMCSISGGPKNVTYNGGCSAPAAPPPPPPPAPVDTCTTTISSTACAGVAGSYGIPSNFTSGNASYSYQMCSISGGPKNVTYKGGCSAPPPPPPPPPPPVDTCTTTYGATACSGVAGTYGIPSNATSGTASYSYQMCSISGGPKNVTYRGGCSAPATLNCNIYGRLVTNQASVCIASVSPSGKTQYMMYTCNNGTVSYDGVVNTPSCN